MSSIYYIIIFLGLYTILFIILFFLHQIVKKLRVPQKSQRIIYTFAILVAFLLTKSIKESYYSVFQQIGVLNKHGHIEIKAEYENDELFDSLTEAEKKQKKDTIKVLKVKEHIDRSLNVLPIIILAHLINALLNYFLWRGALIDEEEEPMVPRLLRQLAGILVYLIAAAIIVAIVYPSLLTAFVATVGTSGTIAAFLGKEPVKQAFTALTLNVTKQIKKGDVLELNGYTGVVQEIGWKSIKLHTSDDNLLTIPNTILVQSITVNYSRPELSRWVEVEVWVNAEVSPNKVTALLKRAASDSNLVSQSPEITLIDVKDFNAKYSVAVCTQSNDLQRVKSEVLSSIWYMLRRERLHPAAKQDQVDNPEKRANKLFNSVPIFEPFTPEEDAIIAQNAQWAYYGYPERVVIEGETDSSLYIVAKGSLEVLVEQDDGLQLQVAKLSKNAIFGEMALLTGEPRKATVRALDDVLVCKISKDSIKPILYERKEILEELSHILAARQMEINKKEKEYAKETEEKDKEGIAKKLLDLMRNFFKEEEHEKAEIQNI